MATDKTRRSIQLNPNNDAYWQSRGYVKRPRNWKELVAKSKGQKVKTGRKKRRGGVPLLWDDWGLLPSDGLGRLSVDDY